MTAARGGHVPVGASGYRPGGRGIGVIPPGPLLSRPGGAVSGAEKIRGESAPHSGQGVLEGWVPSGAVSSNTPSFSHR